eukprot:CAMPEP_0114278044 /NCGR_PEP_ID=MMETSP0059-20121206/1125_1 /TAXON_ID=36894 /ORGANISM="Pyramimonas parkeae, Strain CCMP726" /LENGTH=31 /DNA_ID= /DNA_START= /DNA_END= /DNA_ORIENTATION=
MKHGRLEPVQRPAFPARQQAAARLWPHTLQV